MKTDHTIMKKILLTLLVMLSFAGATMAQQPPMMDENRREEKIQALYVAYMTKELNLTEDEAQRFWPIHSQYEKEMKGLRKDMEELDRQQAMLDIKKKYQDRFSKVLGAARTDEFYKKDNEFRKQMLERLKKIRQQRMENGGGRPLRRGGNFQQDPG